MPPVVAVPVVPAAFIAGPGAALAQLGAGDLLPLLVAEALPPEAAQLGHGEVGPLGLAGLRPELVLERVGEDATPLGFGLDEVMPQGELIDQGAVDAGDLEILPPPGDAIAEFAEPGRQELAKERLVAWSLLLDLAELPGLPALFLRVEHGVEAEAVGMQVGIWDALDRPGGQVDEDGPSHVAGQAVGALAADADAGAHPGFHRVHGLIDRPTEGGEDVGVLRQGVEDGDGFGDGEIDVVAWRPVVLHADGEPLAGEGVAILAEQVEGLPGDL